MLTGTSMRLKPVEKSVQVRVVRFAARDCNEEWSIKLLVMREQTGVSSHSDPSLRSPSLQIHPTGVPSNSENVIRLQLQAYRRIQRGNDHMWTEIWRKVHAILEAVGIVVRLPIARLSKWIWGMHHTARISGSPTRDGLDEIRCIHADVPSYTDDVHSAGTAAGWKPESCNSW